MTQYVAESGESLYHAVKRVKQELKTSSWSHGTLRFNDLVVTVSYDSNADDIAVIYNLKHKLRQLGESC